MISSLAANGLFERSVVRGLRTRPLLAYAQICPPNARRSFPRAASTTSSPEPPTPSSPPPPAPSGAPRKKADFHPAPLKASAARAPDVAAPRTGETADAGTEQAADAGKAIERMSTFQAMKFDVADATARGIMRAPPPGAGTLRLVVHNLWEVLKFYGRGVKAVNANRIQANEMTQRARSAGTPLSRAETRFIRTYKQDVLKLVPFILIAVVLEEIIPLLVLYAPGMLPSTCILPSQRARITRARREGQRAFAALGMYLEPLRKQGTPQGYVPLTAAGGPSLQALCGLAGLSTFGPPPVRRWRLARWLGKIAEDDAQLRAEGDGEHLSADELVEALHDRGITTDKLAPTEYASKLRWWLTNADGTAGDPIGRRIFLLATVGSGGA